MSVRGQIVNHPRSVTSVLAALVGAHWFASTRTGNVPTLGGTLGTSGGVTDLYLGASATVALVGGTAGLVVVFAMTQGLRRFALLRVEGGESLEVNWIHPVTLSFLSSGLLMAAAGAHVTGRTEGPGWLFELATVFAIHAAVRLVWLLANLVATVRQQDVENLQPTATLDQALPNRVAG